MTHIRQTDRAQGIDTLEMTVNLRPKVVDPEGQRVRLSRLSGTDQEADITSGINCAGYGRRHTFRREVSKHWPDNPLPLDPALSYFGLPQADTLVAQVLQLAGCNWRCWYCFVPYQLLLARDQDSSWFTSEQILEMIRQDSQGPVIIDLSGGQPDLVPEWGLWMARAVAKNSPAETYIWIDDNLSTDLIWTELSKMETQEFASYPNIGRVGCFKGFDPESFVFNTNARSIEFDRQFERFGALLRAGFEMYAYVTFPCINIRGLSGRIADFMDKLQSISELLPLRTVPLKILPFTPTESRMKSIHWASLENQSAVVDCWMEELDKRFSESLRRTPITEIAI